MKVEIKNCNNIDEGKFEIEEGKLNIKYAINGTGKSTLAQAIKNYGADDLARLRPFKYLGDNEPAHSPIVQIDVKPNKIVIFDEDYIDKCVFKKDELLENSFEIFVKTTNYDEHMARINELVSNITNAFKQDPELDKLIVDLDSFVDSFGRTQSGYSKAGKLGKSLGEGNKLEVIPPELKVYTAYLQLSDKSVKWIKWQSDGKDYLGIDDKCPYCVSQITTPQETILKVGETYDAKYLTMLNNMLEVFKDLSHYFNKETKEAIHGIMINTSGINKEQIEFLKSVKDEAARLKETLSELKKMSFATLKEVDKIKVELEKKKIKLVYYPKMKSEYTEGKIKVINDSLNSVIEQAGNLQGAIAKQKREIAKTIDSYVSRINGFLETAGYKYTVEIKNENDDYKLILKFVDSKVSVIQVKEHLSYGERNAFALVLFMYQSLKEKADFIILDDPISSFDENKKYAILNMLFRGKDTFQGKTVLMLTHDFEPVIDTIYNLSHLFQPTPIASFLGNVSGHIEEKVIKNNDIKSYIEICKENIDDSTHVIHKLIYMRRLLEITKQKNSAWQMLSNIFHKGREIPSWQPNNGEELRDMTDDEYREAEKEIEKDIPEFKYKDLYNQLQNEVELIRIYESCKSGYEKVQVYRMIFDGDLQRGSVLKKYVDETFHVQNDYLYQLNPREYKVVPQYILDFCDDEIANFKEKVNV